MRDARVVAEIGPDDLASADGLAGVEVTRAATPELVGRVRISHVEAGADYAACTAEAMLPGDGQSTVSDSDMALSLTRGEGRAIAERWLAEAGVARDRARLALPPSWADLGPGDVFRVKDGTGAGQRWRIDRVERAGAAIIDAVRVEPGVYRPALRPDDVPALRRFQPPVPVWPVFLDLPLLRGDEVAHAPWLAVSATPWPGAVAAWASVEAAGGFALNTTLAAGAVMGVTETPLPAARAGAWDRGPALRVHLKGGDLRSASDAALMAGANALAIGDGSPGGWEVIQFADAVPVGKDLWEIGRRLRGQAGTDADMPAIWPPGSVVVLLDGGPKQVALPPDARGQMRHWRIGPATRGPDDPSYRALAHAFAGIGLRPLSPCHLAVDGRHLRWVRRTRIGGDGWDGLDVPLGEERERYAVRLMRDGVQLWQTVTQQPDCEVPATEWDAARAQGAFAVEVAQLSDTFGAGPYARRMIDV